VPFCPAVEKVVESPEGQEIIDNALGAAAAAAAAGYAAAKGWFDGSG